MTEHRIQTPVLDIAYSDAGPTGGPVVFLLHGWPDDVHSWREVIPLLNRAGYRTIAPSLRGFGHTRFLRADTLRDGRGVALAQDAIDLADALGIRHFFVAGHDWGGRAAYILAALFPERVLGIAALGLAFQPGGHFTIPDFAQARLFWYQWLMCVEGGAAAVRKDPVGFARIQWDTWSPRGWYTETLFDEAAQSFTNPDYTAISLHGYRSRFLPEAVAPAYAGLQQKLADTPAINIPTLVIAGGADHCDPASAFEGKEKYFTRGYELLVLEGVGHFIQREAPQQVAEAVTAHFAGISIPVKTPQ